MSSNTVTIVKVKAPWYAFDFILPGQFKKTIPLYSQVKGLRFKAYTINKDSGGRNFGGIYLWDSAADARAWYSPSWYAEVKRKRGAEPDVRYFDMVDMTTQVPAGRSYADLEKNSVAILFAQPDDMTAQRYASEHRDIFRTYQLIDDQGKKSIMLFFVSFSEAQRFVSSAHITTYVLYHTPVLLRNQGQ